MRFFRQILSEDRVAHVVLREADRGVSTRLGEEDLGRFRAALERPRRIFGAGRGLEAVVPGGRFVLFLHHVLRVGLSRRCCEHRAECQQRNECCDQTPDHQLLLVHDELAAPAWR
jgi:hypothetical protein